MNTKNKLPVFVLGLILLSRPSFAETTREVTKTYLSKNPQEITYYADGKKIATEEFDKEGNITKTEGRIPDGLVKEYYRKGKLKAEINFKNGKQEGLAKFYFRNDKLKSEQTYRNGKLDGLAKFFYESGRIESEENYKTGKLEGLTKVYYENGQIGREETYASDLLNGLTKEYSENGNLESEINYRNGIQHDVTKIYWKNRNVAAFIDTYDNGKKINRKGYDEFGRFLFEQKWP